jgi:hypothetical protein
VATNVSPEDPYGGNVIRCARHALQNRTALVKETRLYLLYVFLYVQVIHRPAAHPALCPEITGTGGFLFRYLMTQVPGLHLLVLCN